MRSTSLVAATLAAFIGTAEAHADPADHRGFMARVGLGVGYTGASESLGASSSVSVGGFAVSGHLALGYYVVPNLAIHVTGWGADVFNPSVTVNLGALSWSSAPVDASLFASAFGVGATYFLLPIDVYFSASIGAGVLGLSTTRGSTTTSTSTGAGVALNLAAGKQWAIDPAWGVGVSGQFGWQSNPDTTSSTASYSVNTIQFGLLFSATYH